MGCGSSVPAASPASSIVVPLQSSKDVEGDPPLRTEPVDNVDAVADATEVEAPAAHSGLLNADAATPAAPHSPPAQAAGGLLKSGDQTALNKQKQIALDDQTKELEDLRTDMQEKMGAALAVSDAYENALNCLTKASIGEVKAMRKMPTHIALAVAGALVVLGEDPNKLFDSNFEEVVDERALHRALADPGFVAKLRTVSLGEVDGNDSEQRLVCLRTLVQGPFSNSGGLSKMGGPLWGALSSMVAAHVALADVKLSQKEHLWKEQEILRMKELECMAVAESVGAWLGGGVSLRQDDTLAEMLGSIAWQHASSEEDQNEVDRICREETLEALRQRWCAWAAMPEACTKMPGKGRTAEDGRMYMHPLVGEERPVIEVGMMGN